MASLRPRGPILAFVSVVLAACASATSTASPPGPSPTEAPPPPASSYPEYAAAACTALQSVWRAYGNPETSEMSPMYRVFDESVKEGDVTAANSRAAEVHAELDRGRAAAGIAAGWPPGTASMIQLDRLLRAMEAMVEAKLAATALGHLEATNRGQAAFEAAGGIDAWYGMLGGIDAAAKAAGRPWPACEGVPIG